MFECLDRGRDEDGISEKEKEMGSIYVRVG